MAARPTWKGFLKISLVNIPIRVFPATDSAATISFNQLHAECQTRIQQKRWCPTLRARSADLRDRQGLRVREGPLRRVTEEDIAKVRPESTRVIDLVQFTDAAAIDPIYVERPYYLAPDGAMAQRGVRGHARRHEGQGGHRQAGALRARVSRRRAAAREGPGDVHACATRTKSAAWTTIEELESVPAKVKPDEIKLAKQVIGNFEGRARSRRVPRRVPGGAAADHRRQDRRRGSRRDRGGGAAEGRQPDGRAAPEPRSRQHRQEEGGESRVREARQGRGAAQEASGGTLGSWHPASLSARGA